MTRTLINHQVDSVMIHGKDNALYLGGSSNDPIVTCATPELWLQVADHAKTLADRLSANPRYRAEA